MSAPRWLASLAIVSALGFSGSALAQSFPQDASWVPLTQGGVPIGDPIGDSQNARDIVGDAASPAAYVYSDGANLFFRLRVDGTTIQVAPDNYKPFGWACLMDTNASLIAYELVAGVDGIANPDVVELRRNDPQSSPDDPQDKAEILLDQYPPMTHAREMPALTTFGGTPDVFIDWAVDVADLAAAGVTAETPLRFICGTSNNAQNLAADLISATNATTLTALGSDTYQCGPSGCVRCDTALSCGPTCSACGGATPKCDPASGCAACAQNADCPATDPVCDPVLGTCVDCVLDSDCALVTAPVCDPSSHTCVGCLDASDCAAPAPACDPASQKCVQCVAASDCPPNKICDVSTKTCSNATDTDGDGLPDTTEVALGTNPNDADTDNDALNDGTEVLGGTNPLNPDTDGDGLGDGAEDANANATVDPGETDPKSSDTDADGLGDGVEVSSGTDPLDDDTDDDGVLDGNEDANHNGLVDAGESSPLASDTDADGLQDGTELGLTSPQGIGTSAAFVPDLDPSTKTSPTDSDTDSGGVLDGVEDANGNGAIDPGETDPNVGSDDVSVTGSGGAGGQGGGGGPSGGAAGQGGVGGGFGVGGTGGATSTTTTTPTGPTTSSGFGFGAAPNEGVVAKGAGCDCTTSGSNGDEPAAFFALLAVVATLSRRRR
jgi:MYXO-CTERM domain-containing protein